MESSKLRPWLLAISLVITSFLLSACQYGMDVEVSGWASAAKFSFSRAGIWGLSDPKIGDVDIWDVGATEVGVDRPIWAISGDFNKYGGINNCIPLTHIFYGKIPKGFREIRAATPLEEGHTYTINASGCGELGSEKFRVVQGKIVPSPRR